MLSIFSSSFFKDRRALYLTFGAGLLWLINIVLVLLLLNSKSYPVPVKFSGYDIGVFERGQWYTLYVLPIFTTVAFVINTTLAIKIHEMRPETARVLIVGTYIILILNILVSYSLLRAS